MMKKILIIICFALVGLLINWRPVNARTVNWHADTVGKCISAVQDTSINPYTLGIAGSWRPSRTFVYYASRRDSNATVSQTNIRGDGTFASFLPFWNKQSDGFYKAVYDTNVWVWNSQSTIFNTKGFELENKDPLGRYNAGLYGYDNTLPTAVIQNSHYRESLYEGFEDYDFAANTDTVCPASRNFDYTPYKQYMDSVNSHSGIRSLRVDEGQSIGVGANVIAADDDNFSFAINTYANPCSAQGGTLLKAVKADAKVILPSFSPYAGKRMLVSAWVKEAKACNCTTYSRCNLTISTGSSTITAVPSGNIIDGWQRIEQVVDIPANATTFSIRFNVSGTAVYFDDLRVHPYNANMQSFAYDPVSLRLMAQLDENNYATFYEYDNDGTLIRVKKETERGIKTISETRSALIKE